MPVSAYAPYGAGGIIIRVESDIRRGIPGIDITGLAEGAVREARERVRASFRNSGFHFPQDRLLINLAPAGVRKDGAALDLPIALSVMVAAGIVPAPENVMVMGELELSGRVRPVRGVLAAVAAGLAEGIGDFIVPAENAPEAAILAAGKFTAAATLAEAAHALVIRAQTGALPVSDCVSGPAAPPPFAGDFADVRGQGRYKRALEIAAAGGHNLLVFGPPGAGKTLLARRLPSIMPPLCVEEAVEVTRLHSLAGSLRPSAADQTGRGGALPGRETGEGLIVQPPFRSPHHSASAEGILGGGRSVRPGEISLAHFGILFLDEAPEFRANVLQALREPLEDRVITIVRAEGPVRLPADFQLILAANACPCGRLGMKNEGGGCCCSSEEIRRYWRKFGGALRDRVELRSAVTPPPPEEMAGAGSEGSEAVARRVLGAVEIERDRFRTFPVPCRRNAMIPAGLVERCCPLSGRAAQAFRKAASRLGISGRAFHSILRVARTIADLEARDTIDTVHILEALQHRRQGEDPYDILGVEGC
ncbi:MAG: YifB family Mg chelatase-like AAA ATPase [Treponema sp.]|nr:YifB family Mg chelatase-like AAA ATPase [Treponema sp.]